MVLERQKDIVTRGTAPPEELAAVITLGSYYAIRADPRDYEDGFCVSRATECHSSHFRGIYLVKATEQSETSCVSFQETKYSGRFDIDTVVCELISVKYVDGLVVVDSDEIEEIIVSSNVEM